MTVPPADTLSVMDRASLINGRKRILATNKSYGPRVRTTGEFKPSQTSQHTSLWMPFVSAFSFVAWMAFSSISIATVLVFQSLVIANAKVPAPQPKSSEFSGPLYKPAWLVQEGTLVSLRGDLFQMRYLHLFQVQLQRDSRIF